jgi:hypothetical protein
MRLFIRIIFWGLLTLILEDAYSQSRMESEKPSTEVSQH